MTRRASVAIIIDFDVHLRSDVADITALIRNRLTSIGRNVEVTVLDDGAPTLPAATATGPAKGAKA